MEKKIEVACECPKSDITSMTEAFFCFKPGTPAKPPQENEMNTKATAPPLIMQTMSLTYSITFDRRNFGKGVAMPTSVVEGRAKTSARAECFSV